MMRKSSSLPEVMLAPSARGGALRLPPRQDFPPIDEHLVRPEVTRDEVVRGRRVVAQPANPLHGDRHCELDYVVRAHIRPEYIGSTDLLTRHSERSNFATDTCVRRKGVDPTTDQRYLEELAFEVVHEQSLKDMTERAEELSARGVRRVIAIFVKQGKVREWSSSRGVWVPLDVDSVLRDPCLMKPLRVRALLDAAEADNEVARAILLKRPPALVEHEAEVERKGELRGELRGEIKGRREGKQEAIRMVLVARGISVSDEVLARIRGCEEMEMLDEWLVRAARVGEAEDIFG